jgi:tetratricopeptide (TPR) repeat protein
MNPPSNDWQTLFVAGIERTARHWLSFFRDRPLMDAETWAASSGHALRALTWSVSSGRYNELAADLALALTSSVMRLGYWHEWEITLRQVIAQVAETIDTERLWDLNAVLSYLLLRLHRLDESIALSKQNYQIAAARQDVSRQQSTLMHLAETYLNAEAFDQALPCAENATALAIALGDPIGEADGLINAARALMDLGDIAEAERRLAKALALTTAIGAPVYQAKTHIFLGHATRLRGDWAATLAQFRTALPMVADSNDAVGVGTILSNIGWALSHLGEWAEGAAALEEAIRILAEHGNGPAEAAARQRLAELRRRAAGGASG